MWGGSVAGLMALWRLHGLDEVLREAHEAGVVLAGVSAGALCWTSGGTTDSYGPRLRAWTDGLRLVEGSTCPHYDSEGERRPLYRRLVAEGVLEPGIAADDGVGLHYVDGRFGEAVADRDGASRLAGATADGERRLPVAAPRLTGWSSAGSARSRTTTRGRCSARCTRQVVAGGGGRRAAARAPAGLHRRQAHRAARAPDRRHAGRRRRPRRQDHLARPGPGDRLPDRPARRPRRRRRATSAASSRCSSTCAPSWACRPAGSRAARGVWTADGPAQGGGHRHPGRAGRDHARVRAQLRPRPVGVRPDRARAASPTPTVTSLSAELGRDVTTDEALPLLERALPALTGAVTSSWMSTASPRRARLRVEHPQPLVRRQHEARQHVRLVPHVRVDLGLPERAVREPRAQLVRRQRRRAARPPPTRAPAAARAPARTCWGRRAPCRRARRRTPARCRPTGCR